MLEKEVISRLADIAVHELRHLYRTEKQERYTGVLFNPLKGRAYVFSEFFVVRVKTLNNKFVCDPSKPFYNYFYERFMENPYHITPQDLDGIMDDVSYSHILTVSTHNFLKNSCKKYPNSIDRRRVKCSMDVFDGRELAKKRRMLVVFNYYEEDNKARTKGFRIPGSGNNIGLISPNSTIPYKEVELGKLYIAKPVHQKEKYVFLDVVDSYRTGVKVGLHNPLFTKRSFKEMKDLRLYINQESFYLPIPKDQSFDEFRPFTVNFQYLVAIFDVLRRNSHRGADIYSGDFSTPIFVEGADTVSKPLQFDALIHQIGVPKK